MKKILNFLGTITLIVTSATNLISCNIPQKFTPEELIKLKEEKKININGNTLEWMAPQEEPFKQADDKWFFVIWRGNKSYDWKIVKFQNNNATKQLDFNVDENGQFYVLKLAQLGGWMGIELTIHFKNAILHKWINNDKNYFKSVYRWNSERKPTTSNIDPKTGEIIDWKDIKKDK